MILYVNGDSHAAGAEITNTYCFANDDPTIPDNLGPHPNNLKHSFGFLLAQQLNYNFATDARSGCDNNRIIRTTRDFLKNNNTQDIFVLIGWSTFERKEMFIDQKYYYFGPGFHSSNKKINDLNKQYVLSIDDNTLARMTDENHEKIYNFHCELTDQKIKHLFFNTFQFFDQRHNYYGPVEFLKKDWNNCFIGAYGRSETYWWWLHDQKFKTVNGGYHYGKEAHAAWAARLHNWLTTHRLL